eukprot:s1915_g4.t1
MGEILGEVLGEVFSLSALDQETMKQWTARVKESFEKCKRRASVDFPSEARGWIALNCIGLTEEQKAIVKAKAQGSLQFDDISAALRSCFPAYRAVGKKKGASVFQAELETVEPVDNSENQFSDVEAFLADHELNFKDLMDEQDETFTEGEAAEALAVSWKERRTEIAKFKQARQFGSAGKSRRSFRIEVEELKKKTRCRKCGRIGHWARECKYPPSTGKDTSDSATGSNTGVNYVEVGYDLEVDGMQPSFVGMATEALAATLVQSPGFGVVDSGCGRTLIGRDTLELLRPLMSQAGYDKIVEYEVENSFRFGNGAVEKSLTAVRLPVGLAGKFGLIDAAVISGCAPLLIGRPTLEKLKAKIDFDQSMLHFLDSKAKMVTNAAGQVLINILEYPMKVLNKMAMQDSRPIPKDPINSPSPSKSTDAANENHVKSCKTKVTLKKKECRCLLAQFNKKERMQGSKVLVAELFSPPRFTKYAQQLGYQGLSYDIQQGCDLDDLATQKRVSKELDENKPELLVVCPPCRNRGGWEHLNRMYRSPLETARLLRRSRRQVAFCAAEIQKQLKRGGEFLFEHPWPSEAWNDPSMTSLKRKFGVDRIDMCAYGLKCPDTLLPIQKATGIMNSNTQPEKFRKCMGCQQHRPIEGKLKDGQNVSAFCAKYTQEFVKSMLHVMLPDIASPSEQACLSADADLECLVGEPLAEPVPDAIESQPAEHGHNPKIMQAVRKLHCNLGHPSSKDLIRILRHSGATAEAVRAAQSLECEVCRNHVQPASALPAKTSRVTEFNEKIGLDVKYIQGWKENQLVPCISIIDYATSLHVMAPIFKRETAELTKGVLRDSWIAWAGVPKVLEMDPSSSNLSDMLGDFCESMGINVQHIAADSHWQLGKVERHGHWFAKIFERVCDECRPSTPEEFVDCVIQTQTAKNSLISESGASPYQLVFGRNPRLPQDLLQEDTHVAASDAVLADAGYQRSQAIRQAARLAVLQCQDDRALRNALRARPRVQRQFMSGDWVYYWRSQKWQNGVLLRGGRWHGAALVLGRIGVNWVVAHRRNLFRCSPEQLRHATHDEQAIAKFDQSELLGIKTLLEKGQFPKSQFVDLINQDEPEPPEHVEARVQQGAVARSAGELVPPPAPVVPEDGSAPVDQPVPEGTTESRDPEAIRRQLKAMPRTESYGPWKQVRHRVKSPPEYLSRPPVMLQDDFAEMMQEMVPVLIEQQLNQQSNDEDAHMSSTSPRGDSSKREASADHEQERPAVRARLSEDSPDGAEAFVAELLQGRSLLAKACPERDQAHWT